tara:strand:+ start:959 stop:1363 length:405 start_codon:yes stop_codon:yes gene_type:complete
MAEEGDGSARSSSHSSSSLPFAHLSFFKSLSNAFENKESKIGKSNELYVPPRQNEKKMKKKKHQQEKCYQCRLVGTGVCAAATSVIAYDRLLGPKRPLAHSVLYVGFGLGFAALGVLRWNDLTFDDVEKMWRRI